jgi:hypothetical protein
MLCPVTLFALVHVAIEMNYTDIAGSINIRDGRGVGPQRIV